MFASSRAFRLRFFCTGLVVLCGGVLSACAEPAPAEDEASIGTTAEALSTSPATSFFVTKLYSDLLRRAPSSSELGVFVGVSRATVVSVVLDSAEYRSRQVHDMYKEYLGRAPSDAEVSTFVGQLSLGSSFEDVAHAILVSAEYYALAGGTDARFLERLYANLLGRTPSRGDLSAFLGKSRTLVVSAVQGSSEARSRVVEQIHGSLLRRAASAIEVNAWLATWLGERGVLAAVASSDEYSTPPRR